jgi:transcriptional regulator with XRE-family HTH domain
MNMATMKANRIKARLTQTALARKTGLSLPCVSNMERGKFKPRPSTQKRVEHEIGKVDWLATGGFKEKQGVLSTWEMVEQAYRKALFQIRCLPIDQRSDFINLAKQYLTQVEESINA